MLFNLNSSEMFITCIFFVLKKMIKLSQNTNSRKLGVDFNYTPKLRSFRFNLESLGFSFSFCLFKTTMERF